MIRKILSAKTHSGRLMGFLIIIKAPIFCKRIWIQWKILQSVPVCQLSVKKRGLSYLISRRDPEKEEIFHVLKPPSNHKHFLLQGGDSKIKPIFPSPLLPWKGKISARNENFRRFCLLQYNNMPCCPLLSCVKSYNWRKKTSVFQWSHH